MNPDNPEDNAAPGWEGILLAFDFGLKRTGVAIGNTLLKKAEPLMVIHEESNAGRFRAIESLVVKWHPVGLVVGLPLHADGTAHGMTKRCRRFANQLHGRFGLGTVLVDERFSSCVLNFKRGEEDDAHAAALILQQYFDERSS